MLRKCPHHGLEVWLQVSSFYNGLTTQARQTLDVTAGGIFGNKRPQEAYDLIKEIAMNRYQWHNPRNTRSSKPGLYQVDPVTSLTAQVKALTKQLNQMNKAQVNAVTAEFLPPEPKMEDEQVAFVNANNPYSNTYNPGWRNHPNFSWKESNNNNMQSPEYGQQQQTFQQPKQQ